MGDSPLHVGLQEIAGLRLLGNGNALQASGRCTLYVHPRLRAVVSVKRFGGHDDMIRNERVTATLDGDFVVFLIGLRINSPLKIHKWWPVLRAMPRMLEELHRHPELGFV